MHQDGRKPNPNAVVALHAAQGLHRMHCGYEQLNATQSLLPCDVRSVSLRCPLVYFTRRFSLRTWRGEQKEVVASTTWSTG